MHSVQDTAYPRLKSNPSTQALETVYTPTDEEIAFARSVTRGDLPRLGFLIMLKIFQTVGYPVQIAKIPKAIIVHIAARIGVSLSPDHLAGYDSSGTRRRHLSIIREYLDIQLFNSSAHQVMVTAMKTAVQTQHDLVNLINVAMEELVRQRFELPGFTTLDRSAHDIRAASNAAFYQQIFDALSVTAQMQLNKCLFSQTSPLKWRELRALGLFW